jgi:hypothetical protein
MAGEPNHYSRRKVFGGLEVDQARQMKNMKHENARLCRALPISRRAMYRANSIMEACSRRTSSFARLLKGAL